MGKPQPVRPPDNSLAMMSIASMRTSADVTTAGLQAGVQHHALDNQLMAVTHLSDNQLLTAMNNAEVAREGIAERGQIARTMAQTSVAMNRDTNDTKLAIVQENARVAKRELESEEKQAQLQQKTDMRELDVRAMEVMNPTVDTSAFNV